FLEALNQAEGVLHKEPIPTSRGRSQYPHLLHDHTLHGPQPDRLVNPRLHHEEADGLLGLIRYLHEVLVRTQVLTLQPQAFPLTLKRSHAQIPSSSSMSLFLRNSFSLLMFS